MSQAAVDDAPSAVDRLIEPTSGRRRRRRWWAPVLTYAATVFLLITFNFALPRLMPGDPIDALLAFGSPNYVTNAQTRANLAAYYHLDRSLPEQYVHYLGGLARGDLGVSTVTNVSVAHELGGRIGWSFLLIGAAMAVSVLIGIPTGVHSGWKRGRRVDRGLLTFFLSVQNLPVFLLASVVFVVFSAQLGVFPLGGATTPFNHFGALRAALDETGGAGTGAGTRGAAGAAGS